MSVYCSKYVHAVFPIATKLCRAAVVAVEGFLEDEAASAMVGMVASIAEVVAAVEDTKTVREQC